MIFWVIGWNPHYQVELIFAPGSAVVSVDAVKKLIFRSFKTQKDMWEEMCDFEEFGEQISAATTLEQIFAAFNDFNQA